MTTSPDLRPVTRTEADDLHATLRCLAGAGWTIDDLAWLRKPGQALEALVSVRHRRGASLPLASMTVDMQPWKWEVFSTNVDLTEIDGILGRSGHRTASPDEIVEWGKNFWDGHSDVVTISARSLDLCRLWCLRGDRLEPSLAQATVRLSAPWPKNRWLLVVRKSA